MTNILLHEYYYRYRQKRQLIKNDDVDTGNFEEGRTKLTDAIAEFESKFPDADTRRDFSFGEKIMMKHALAHLNAVIDQDNPPFIDGGDGTTIKHHDDIVKDALLRVPKSYYID